MILADDMGYSDLGCYGSEIETPNLDRLASQGTRLSNFRVNPMCVVTRTSLMTGHEHSQSDNYRRSLPLSRALASAGYQTSISGKWHQPAHPLDQGFDRFYGFLGGAINNFTGSDAIMRQRKPEQVPPDWFATDAFTTHAIESIDAAIQAKKPFFAYLAFNAPHTPLNVPKNLVDKYQGRFDEGWEVLRKRRFAYLRKSALIDERYQDSPPHADVRPWDQLPEDFRKLEAFRMQTYAAVVDNLDTNVGRLLAFLEEKKVADNTIVIFFSDNGGDYANGNIATDKSVVPWDRNSAPFMSNGWAYLKCTPFRYYKTSAHEGGLRVPFIIRWPAGLKHAADTVLSHQAHVTDLYPTFLELAETSYAPTESQAPLHGKSLVPLLTNPDLSTSETEHPVVWALQDTTRGYLDYPWKIVSINEGPWQLFNLQQDPCEITNLAQKHPLRLENLARAWEEFARTETTMPLAWRKPLRTEQHGWGFHRLTKIWPFETSTPLCSQPNVPLETKLSFTFKQPLDFSNSKGKTIRLYRVQDPDTPVWTSDPEPTHRAQGQATIAFDLPTLHPDTAYFLLADDGWAQAGGEQLHGLNDGAYWFRFRTKTPGRSDRVVAGQLHPQQHQWHEQYKKQPNVPKPEEMLLNTDAEPDLSDGFTSLFNGKDLKGWTLKGGTCTFEVSDGLLVGKCVPGSSSTYLSTERADFTDFVFTCEMKWEVDCNSGVMFRAQSKPGKNDTEIVFGPQVEMEGFSKDRRWSGGIYGQSCGGYFYPLWLNEHKEARAAAKKGEWNRMTISAKGNVVKTWINGVPVSHWIDDGSYPKGFFGLQIHKGVKGTVLWKNIRVKRLVK